MTDKERKDAIKNLFSYYKKATSKNATEEDMVRYTYYTMYVVANNPNEEFNLLLSGVLGASFKFGTTIPDVASKLVQARIAPPYFYDASISPDSPDLMSEVRNRSEVTCVVEGSKWKEHTTKFFENKNLPEGKVEDYTKALMLIEQIGVEGKVEDVLRRHTKAKLPKLYKKVIPASKFMHRDLEVQATVDKAMVAVLGGQEKYDQLMKILNKEVPFDAEANKILQEALKACDGFGQLVRHLNSSSAPIEGDYRIGHKLQTVQNGRFIPEGTSVIKNKNGTFISSSGNMSMGYGLYLLNTALNGSTLDGVRTPGLVDRIHTLQAENGIYRNDPSDVHVQLKPTVVETVVTETPVETVVTETPVETVVTETPVETVVTETPVETVVTETPVETVDEDWIHHVDVFVDDDSSTM